MDLKATRQLAQLPEFRGIVREAQARRVAGEEVFRCD